MEPVILESPFSGDVEKNILYARLCMHDCLVNHNEAPYASHLLYTQDHVLDDTIPEERSRGINAGFVWRGMTRKTVFYTDLGMSGGMTLGMEDLEKKGLPFETRTLPPKLQLKFKNEFNKILESRDSEVICKGVQEL
jgi:hypothetical protein